MWSCADILLLDARSTTFSCHQTILSSNSSVQLRNQTHRMHDHSEDNRKLFGGWTMLSPTACSPNRNRKGSWWLVHNQHAHEHSTKFSSLLTMLFSNCPSQPYSQRAGRPCPSCCNTNASSPQTSLAPNPDNPSHSRRARLSMSVCIHDPPCCNSTTSCLHSTNANPYSPDCNHTIYTPSPLFGNRILASLLTKLSPRCRNPPRN